MFICVKKQIQKVVKLRLCFDDAYQDIEIELRKGILIRVTFIKNDTKNEVVGRVLEVRDNMIILDASYTYNGDIIGILYTAIRDIGQIPEEEGIQLTQKVDDLKNQVVTNSQNIDQLQTSLVWDDM